MADLTITTTAVIPVAGFSSHDCLAGVAIEIGQTCYVLSTDSKAYLADADAAGKVTVKGIALNKAVAANQPVKLMTGGNLGLGAILTATEQYVLSDTAGGIMPIGDLDSGDTLSVIGHASTTSNLVVAINNTGTAKA